MKEKYILGIDQSTQGTKALLFDSKGKLIFRTDLLHKQIVNDLGWVEHNPVEIYQNCIMVVKNIVIQSGVDKSDIIGVGISNQRETAMVWDRESGQPIYNAIVWQCARGTDICNEIESKGFNNIIRERTGLQLSPYFSAAKISWILRNVEGAKERCEQGKLCCGTMDSWLVYQLTKGRKFRTDYSNASRTQLFNIHTLGWDREICQAFGVNPKCLAQVTDSDGEFGTTDFDGFLDEEIPIHGVLGDSHGALFGQGCIQRGMVKSTYGTGSSIMMNIGEKPILSDAGLVTSLAWGIHGKVEYVLEGNINYTGAVISWLQKDLNLISSPNETQELARRANPADHTYLVPAFSGLGAPYWDSNASGIFYGMSRTTTKAEIVRSALDCIAYQIADIVNLMRDTSKIEITELRVDGGPTRNEYLMQFQSDLLQIPVYVPEAEELSGIGAAYLAGIALHLYEQESLLHNINSKKYFPEMAQEVQEKKYQGWKKAVSKSLS